MKATLTFTLPEEQEEFALAMKAGKLESAKWEFEQVLRSAYKYGSLNDKSVEEFKPEEVVEILRSKFFECFNED